jgi:hypothetical protein
MVWLVASIFCFLEADILLVATLTPDLLLPDVNSVNAFLVMRLLFAVNVGGAMAHLSTYQVQDIQ